MDKGGKEASRKRGGEKTGEETLGRVKTVSESKRNGGKKEGKTEGKLHEFRMRGDKGDNLEVFNGLMN